MTEQLQACAVTAKVESACAEPGWRVDFRRAGKIAAAAIVFALAVNHFHPRAVPLLASDGPGAWPERAERITIEQLRTARERQARILLLDVRSAQAFKAAHPAEALNVPALTTELFLQYYENIGPLIGAMQIVVIICESEECGSGDRAAKLLAELKHNNARVLHGGWRAYLASGMEIAKEQR